MTDGQLLLAVFAAFYLAECLHWLPVHATVLRTAFIRRGWSASVPSPLLATAGRGLTFSWPLPPLGGFLATQSWPVIPDAEGLWIGDGQLHAGQRLSWQGLTPKVEQRKVHLAPARAVQCVSLSEASKLAKFLHTMTGGSDLERRLALGAFWQGSLSIPRARAAVRRYHLAAHSLRLSCFAVQVVSFLYLPFLYWRFGGTSLQVLMGAVALLALTSATAGASRYFARRLFPGGPHQGWGDVFQLTFIPAQSIRAHDRIGAEMLAGLHPLPAAARVLKPDALAAFSSRLWRDWKFRPASDPLHPAAQLVLPRLFACNQRLGITMDQLEAPPARQHGAASYCPRCHAQFSLATTTCETCGGVATAAWPG